MISKTTLSLGLLLGLALGLAPAARAQTDFRPGYVVLPAGDTLRGEVDFRGARRNSLLCQFRAAATAAVQQLRPGVLRAYGYRGGDAYRTALVPLPDSGQAPARPRLPRPFFLQVLVDGPAVLYARRDEMDRNHYYVQPATATAPPVAELLVQQEEIFRDGHKYLRTLNLFRGPLNAAFADCPAVQQAVGAVSFSESALMRITRRYNECRQPALAARAPARYRMGEHLSLGLLLGVQTSRLYFVNAFDGRAFVANPAPEIGLAAQFVSSQMNEKLMLRLELLYGLPQEHLRTFNQSNNGPRSLDLRIRTSYLRVPLVLRYTYPRGPVRPLAELGLVYGQAFAINADGRERAAPAQPYSNWEPFLSEAGKQPFEIGYLLGLGAQVAWPASRPLTVLLRAEHSSGFANDYFLDNYVWRYHLLLGINLTK